MQLELGLCLEDCRNYVNYYTDFLTEQNISYKISPHYNGIKILVASTYDNLNIIAEHSCRFILDFYLREAVISKIYDEYPCFNTHDACNILCSLSKKISQTPVKDNILSLITSSNIFKPESYVIFNIKQIMRCIYAMTDNIANSLLIKKEEKELMNVIKTFSKLSFTSCQRADVEFSSCDECIVTIDDNTPVFLLNDELIAYLVHSSPQNVSIKNSYYNPELSDIISEIFYVK